MNISNLFNNIDIDDAIAAIERQMTSLVAQGNMDVVRLSKEVQKTPDDPEQWFELGVALTQSGIQYHDWAVQLAEFRYRKDHPEVEEADEEEHPEVEAADDKEENITLQVDDSAAKPLYEAALSAFGRVLQLAPDYYGVHTQMGFVYSNMRDYPHAEECYLQALKDDEEDFSAAEYLSLTYRDMGNDELADKYYDISLQLNS